MHVLRVWPVLPIRYVTFENIYYSIHMQCIHIGLVANNGPSVAYRYMFEACMVIARP